MSHVLVNYPQLENQELIFSKLFVSLDANTLVTSHGTTQFYTVGIY